MKREQFTPESIEQEKASERIVVTGGTEGIGNAITQECLMRGDMVAICARNGEKLEAMERENEQLLAERVDLSDRRQAKKFIDEAIQEMGGLDTLILNAAVTGVPHRNETEADSEKRKSEVFRVNEVAQVALTRAALAELRAAQGTVIFITSRLASMETVPPGSEDYAASKKRMEKYMKDLIARPGNEQIAVFSINPGPVDTRMHEEIIEHGPEPMSKISKMIKDKGMMSDPRVIGRIIAKISSLKKQFDPATHEYDAPIASGSVIDVGKENIEYEQRLMEAEDGQKS